jgi:prepilin-type N-terminal cleavage/methylation domain-containing protein
MNHAIQVGRTRQVRLGATAPTLHLIYPARLSHPAGATHCGFTLLEVLIATAVLLACMILLTDLAHVGQSHAKDAEDLAAAQLVCQTRLNEMLAGAKPIRAVSQEHPPSLPGWILSVEVEPLKKSGLVAVRIIVKEDPSADEFGTVEAVGDTDEFSAVDDFSAVDEFSVESPDVPDIQAALEEGTGKQFMLVHWMVDRSRSAATTVGAADFTFGDSSSGELGPDEPGGLFTPSSFP